MASKSARNGKAILGAQIYIQQDHVGRILGDASQQLRFGCGLNYTQSLTSKIVCDEIPNVLIIIYNQHY